MGWLAWISGITAAEKNRCCRGAKLKIQEAKRLGSEILTRFGEGLFRVDHGLPFRMDPLPVLVPFHLGGFADPVENHRHHADESYCTLASKCLRSLPPLMAKFLAADVLPYYCTQS